MAPCNAEEDILLRQELDAMAEEHPDRVKIYYVLDKPPAVRQPSTVVPVLGVAFMPVLKAQ